MPLTKQPIKWMKKNLRPEIKTLDQLAEWCAMTKWELQHHIAWCFKRFADFTDYVNHDRYFSHLNESKSIQGNAVAFPVMFLQRYKQAVRMVRCTGSTRWRKDKPPCTDTVLLWLVTNLDSHISWLLDVFVYGWSVFSLSRMVNRALKSFLHWFVRLQKGR